MGTPVTTVASVPTQGAGSVVEFSFDDGTSYVQIPFVESIPEIGTDGSFVEVTPIDELVRQYVSGIQTPPEWDFAFRDIADDANQQLLIDAADGVGSTVLVRATLANGRVADFDLALSGHKSLEVGLESILMHAVKGQVSGSISWSKVA